MNSIEFRKTGGLAVSPSVLRLVLSTQPALTDAIRMALLNAARHSLKRPNSETCAQMFVDVLMHHGVPGLKIVTRNMPTSLVRWKGISACKQKKALRRWADQ